MNGRKKTTGHLMELKKGQKQGRDERTQEDYWTSAKIHSRCPVVFLLSFINSAPASQLRIVSRTDRSAMQSW